MKKLICFLLCLSCLLCTTACKDKGDNTETVSTATSSSVSSAPTVPSTPDSSVPDTSDTTSDTTTSEPLSDETKEMLEMLYGFSSIDKIGYYCIRNTPDNDAIYAVTTITTNNGDMNDIDLDITCADSSITAERGMITIPREYTKNHSSVTLTATHTQTNLKRDFTINFEPEWKIEFEDNFDGTQVNTEVWNVWHEERDWRYSYLDDNMFLDGNGNLVNRMAILEEPDSATGESRTSGAMTTQGTFETTYGYFEIRMTSHLSPGLMGAFWLMCGDMGDPDAADDGTATNGCEIDIMETFYHNLNPAHTIHWDGYTHTKSKGFSNVGRDDIFDGNYHTFALRWSPNEYAFLIDGVVTARTTEVDICTEPGYLLISSHFNNSAGEPSFGVGEHSDMIVDYVKVYQSPADHV